ncbi:MAG: hypothetical protein ACO1NU_08645 [Arcticibacter sp.]
MTLKEEISWCKGQIKQGYHPEVLRSILRRLQIVENKQPPSEYYTKAVALYKSFLTYHKLPLVFDARQGKALKEILIKLKDASTAKTEEAAYLSLEAIFSNWSKTGDYISRKKTLVAINSNLLEIIDNIKNGATKRQQSLSEAEQLASQLGNRLKRSP